MTYYSAQNLAESFRTVRKNTIQMAEEIPENKYSFRATPDVMSIGELLAHIAVTPTWQIEVHGQKIEHIDFARFTARLQQAQAEQEALRTKADIVRALKENGERFATFVEALDEATLATTVSFPPPVQPPIKTRFEMLMGPKEHEMHHRGQLMMLQRMIGLVPPLTRRRQEMQSQAANR